MTIKELNEFMRDHGFCNTDNEEDLPKKYVCDLVESALKEGRNKAIDEFAERLKEKILEEIDEVSESQRNYEVGSDMSLTCSHIMGTLRDVYHRVIDEIAEEMRGCGMNCKYLKTSKLINGDYETTLYRCKNVKSNRFGKSSFDRFMICNNCLLHQKKVGTE